MNTLKILLIMSAFLGLISCNKYNSEAMDPNIDWRFIRLAEGIPDKEYHTIDYDDTSWEHISLPHTARIEPLVVNDQWQGICWYRRSIKVPNQLGDQKVWIEFEAAMSAAQFWINGVKVQVHLGGYLPIVIDATPYLKKGKKNTIAVRLDNQDNASIGPKPLNKLDFNTYGGLYRKVNVLTKDHVHISHPVLANKIAGGGVFITTPKVSKTTSEVRVKTHIINEELTRQSIEIVHEILFKGKIIHTFSSAAKGIPSGSDAEIIVSTELENIKLWHPDHPYLYKMITKVFVDGKLMDEQSNRFGFRHFEFKGLDLYINGEKTFLRGVNRHQDYPFVGYALSDNAQYRDAKKIKEAGFDYIRLSHYPHSPAFMDACDELGLVVTAAIMGWQYYNDDDSFRNYCYNSARQLVRRDRNHPSVLLWEVSLNETQMPEYFMDSLHTIVHEEFPGDNIYTTGWKDCAYDVYFQARQHKIKHNDYDRKHTKPYAVSEYGDWEYYSNNAGLNQDKLDKTLRFETSSRQRRAYGEERLLRQVNNIHESHNDNLTTPAFADSYWVMYDYNRGYHSDIEFSGVSDIFRIPKLGYYFYKSQRKPSAEIVLKIATYWTQESPTDVKILSNCEEVALYLNDALIARQKPDTDKNSTHIPHPPFTFNIDKFEAGNLRAVGFIDGKQVVEEIVRTPKAATKLKVWLDESNRKPQAGVNDVLFLYIAAVDTNGTIVSDFSEIINLKIKGDFEIMNNEEIRAEAGIATALIGIGQNSGICRIDVNSGDINGHQQFTTIK